MACMEHKCRDCGHVWFNNEAYDDCPKCKSGNVSHFFDEPDDFEPEDEEEDEDE